MNLNVSFKIECCTSKGCEYPQSCAVWVLSLYCYVQSSTDAAYIARHAALRVGIPQNVPALTVNRLCGSGFQSIVSGLQELELGIGSIALCGGSESMSQSPYTLYGARFGTKLGQDLKVCCAFYFIM